MRGESGSEGGKAAGRWRRGGGALEWLEHCNAPGRYARQHSTMHVFPIQRRKGDVLANAWYISEDTTPYIIQPSSLPSSFHYCCAPSDPSQHHLPSLSPLPGPQIFVFIRPADVELVVSKALKERAAAKLAEVENADFDAPQSNTDDSEGSDGGGSDGGGKGGTRGGSGGGGDKERQPRPKKATLFEQLAEGEVEDPEREVHAFEVQSDQVRLRCSSGRCNGCAVPACAFGVQPDQVRSGAVSAGALNMAPRCR
eukprot:152114-Chlamydomonas_euryale.AAC.2